MDTRINHAEIEKKWQSIWEQKAIFHSVPDNRKKYSIVIPPPNVTSTSLHCGHALNGIFQDITIRHKKMQGFNTVWVPGLDHAGIATQMKVEKQLREQGIDKNKLSRQEFLDKIIEWKGKCGGNIINQQKKMGFACDWKREKFTMDPDYSKFVRSMFVKLFNDGLIYRGEYIVNWCPILQTAIADDEVLSVEAKSKLFYLKYPIKGENNKFIIVATSRPESIFGDVAVAYNPNDPRYTELKGKIVLIPIINKEIPLIPDEYVKIDFGSGLVKITPAHDKNDYEVGKRHNLPIVSVIDKAGKITNTSTKYDGLDREIARKIIIKDLMAANLVEKIEDYMTTLKKCYRSDAIIEPMLTKQWFVKMKPLAEMAKKLVEDKEVEIIPERSVKIFYNWVDNIRDWCISRQLIWGHQIPIWYCQKCNKMTCSNDDPIKCSNVDCQSENIIRDNDVLDTWFSSWLWPFAVFNDEERDYYYPTDILVTGEDILFFWVIRMMMASAYLYNKTPFKKVYLHGIIRTHDENKKVVKMSKSLNNAIDPLEITGKYGVDVLRFTLALHTPKDSDLLLTMKSFDVGKTFCTKYWNVVRFCTSKLDKTCIDEIDSSKLDNSDREILGKLNELTDKLSENIEKCVFCDAAKDLYTFVWDTFANGYLEQVKNNLTSEKQKVLFTILRKITKLLYPFIPHITEEVWDIMRKLYNHSNKMLCEI
jgi:valyl-tRNA synthetase